MTEFELDPTVELIAREARRPVSLGAEARERLLAAVRAETAPVRSTEDWNPLRPSHAIVMTRPKFAALAAGLVGIGVLLGGATNFGRAGHLTGQLPVVGASSSHLPASSDTVLTFFVVAPSADKVSMVGDFNQWDGAANPMERVGNSNAWMVTVPLSAGRHLYSFVSVAPDGSERWIADPHAPAAPDGFGRTSSVVLVGKGSAS
jgi:hypothetical protein